MPHAYGKATLNLNTTGADGSALSGEKYFSGPMGNKFTGYVEEVSYKFLVDADTSDLTVYVKRNGTDVPILTITNSDGSGVNVTKYPRHAIHDGTGATVEDLIGNDGGGTPVQYTAQRGEERFFVHNERIYAKVVQTDALSPAVNLELYVSPARSAG